jgi:cell volume regulation protein A
MFVMLGLLVEPGKLLPVALIGVLLGAGLAFVARPLVVALCLLPFRLNAREIGYVSWVGIRGAVPIILATFPILAGLPGSEEIFHVVFFIVVFSAFIPGATIVPVTRRLRLDDPEPPTPTAALEMNSLGKLNAEIHVYHIEEGVVACGARLSELSFPEESSVLAVVRGDDLLPARGGTTLRTGDFVYVFCRPHDEPRVGLLLGRLVGD